MNISQVREKLKFKLLKARRAWVRGCCVYALELIEDYKGGDAVPTKEELLNGAEDWAQYSWGGCSLIYDGDIAERLCTPTELRLTKNGEKAPNNREEWLDVQARALAKACGLIQEASKGYV